MEKSPIGSPEHQERPVLEKKGIKSAHSAGMAADLPVPTRRESMTQLPQLPKVLDPMVQEMHETIKILQLKIRKLEELLQLKDNQIQELNTTVQRLQQVKGL
jgi:hypothetical protein